MDRVHETTIKYRDHTIKMKYTRSLHGVKGEWFVGSQTTIGEFPFPQNTNFYGPINDPDKVMEMYESLLNWQKKMIDAAYEILKESINKPKPAFPDMLLTVVT